MMRVIYETTSDCTKCPHNTGKVCMKLRKYLYDICFERDCPLPSLEEVEQFTRYITSDRGLDCCGNCRNWSRWQYNKHIKRDIGVCCADGKRVYTCDSEACEEYDEMSEKRFKLKENLEEVLIEDTITQSQYSIYGIVDVLNEQQSTIEKQELVLQHLEELLELSENLNKSYREKLIDMNLKMVIDDE